MPAEAPGKELEIYDDEVVGTEMYYRVPNGEIIIGRVGPDEDGIGSEQRKRVREGWTPLTDYGTFKIQPYHMEHPFEVLFQRGGAKEMSVQQILAQGFHFREQLVPRCHATVGEPGHFGNKKVLRHSARCWEGAQAAQFPQLEDKPLPFACKWCSEDGEPRLFALARGLRQHETVMHQDEIGSDRLGQQLIQGLGGAATPITHDAAVMDMKGELLKLQEQIEAMREAQPGAGFTPARTPYVCGLCGEAQPNTFALNKHISACKGARELVPA